MFGVDGSCEQYLVDWVVVFYVCFYVIEFKVCLCIIVLVVLGQQYGFVVVDVVGEVLVLVKLWCDISMLVECVQIMDVVGGVVCSIVLVGNFVFIGYIVFKLFWIRIYWFEVYVWFVMILLLYDYFNFVLIGECFCEYGDVLGMGWLDVCICIWLSFLLCVIDFECDFVVCLLCIVVFEEMLDIDLVIVVVLGLCVIVKVVVGGGDNMMVVIGIGCVVFGCLVMSLGILGILFVYLDMFVVDLDGKWVVFCLFIGGWLLLICMMNCMVVIEQVVDVFGFSIWYVDGYLWVMLFGVDGLVMLLFFNGECMLDLLLGKGVLVGLDMVNMILVYFYCVVVEGVMYSLKYGYDVFVCVGMWFECIVLIGGGSNSVQWW